MKKIFLLLMFAFTCGIITVSSQSVAEKTPDMENYATIYIYRPGSYEGALMGFDIHVTYADGTEEVLGRSKNKDKFEAKLTKEGKAEIWAKTEKKSSVTVNVKFGEKYYVKATVKTGIALNRPELTMVYPDQGAEEYENLGRKKAKK